MKKVLLVLLFVGALFTTKAQKTTFLAAGASISSGVITDNVEIGKTFGKNNISLVGTATGILTKELDKYAAGVRYAREFSNDSSFSVQANTAFGINLTGTKSLVIEPGASVTYYVFKAVGVRANISFPIQEANLNKSTLSGGLQLIVRL